MLIARQGAIAASSRVVDPIIPGILASHAAQMGSFAFNGTAFAAEPLDLTGLQAWYSFEESNMTLDSSGNGHDLELVNPNGEIVSGAGKKGQGMTKTGTTGGNYLQIPAALANSLLNGTFYISFWAKIPWGGANTFILSAYSSGQQSRVNIIKPQTGNRVEIWLRTGPDNEFNAIASSSDEFPDNEWFFVEAFYEHGVPPYARSEYGIAINNGSFFDEFDTNTTHGAGIATGSPIPPFRIGHHSSVTTNVFNGSIDELTLWNTMPTPERRVQLYAEGQGRTIAPITPPPIIVSARAVPGGIRVTSTGEARV